MALRIRKELQGIKTASHARSPKQEKSMAARVGGDRVRGSGCGFEKGDVRLKGIARIECKNTIRNSFSITREMLDKIETAAVSSGEVPAIAVDFITLDGKVVSSVVVIPAYALETLLSLAGGAS